VAGGEAEAAVARREWCVVGIKGTGIKGTEHFGIKGTEHLIRDQGDRALDRILDAWTIKGTELLKTVFKSSVPLSCPLDLHLHLWNASVRPGKLWWVLVGGFR
jgi:hypothetical protein